MKSGDHPFQADVVCIASASSDPCRNSMREGTWCYVSAKFECWYWKDSLGLWKAVAIKLQFKTENMYVNKMGKIHSDLAGILGCCYRLMWVGVWVPKFSAPPNTATEKLRGIFTMHCLLVILVNDNWPGFSIEEFKLLRSSTEFGIFSWMSPICKWPIWMHSSYIQCGNEEDNSGQATTDAWN